jgi:glycogen operon protein
VAQKPLIPEEGSPHPLGATLADGGVNFSVYSTSATGLELLLFTHADDPRPSHVVAFDPQRNRTHQYWHAYVPALRAGQLYAYRATGPWNPSEGLRFDRTKVLLDPYGRAVAVPPSYDRRTAAIPSDDTAIAMKSVVVETRSYDWEGDRPLHRPFAQTVIYELHVRGFTCHPSSGVPEPRRGTYAGLIEKIPYLVDLGVTAIELLPVFQFDPQDAPPGRRNFWGYCPVSFFAPHHGYASRPDPLHAVDEFRDMVKALHRAGLEVILDVVFNHTAEGDHRGPTLCFRGLENAAYYILEADRARYANYTGTGNTLNANHPIVRRLIVDSLHYWVEDMHIDGFRFDLASILSRDASGRPLAHPPILSDIDNDPVLAGTKLIAEAWDAAGLYQVGSFAGDWWKEWNGRFRDDVRSFWKGDGSTVGAMANRLLGSPDIYGHDEREPEKSVNFVTCHDGFTLNDLVSYDCKHNEANGEGNRDGSNDNRSWNCGVEGATDDPAVEQLRNRQVKNFLATTLLSLGAPMLLMGDEVRRTQQGNNNGYCLDDDTTWFDWTLLDRHDDVRRFVRVLISQRLRRDISRPEWAMTLNQLLRRGTVTWHGVQLNQPDWHASSHTLAATVRSVSGTQLSHVALNAWSEPLTFAVPSVREGWRRWIDTSREPPDDICEWGAAPPLSTETYDVGPRSLVVLIADVDPMSDEVIPFSGSERSVTVD